MTENDFFGHIVAILEHFITQNEKNASNKRIGSHPLCPLWLSPFFHFQTGYVSLNSLNPE